MPFQVEHPFPIDRRSVRRKLVRAMGSFTLALIALMLVFVLLWMLGGESAEETSGLEPGQAPVASEAPTTVKPADTDQTPQMPEARLDVAAAAPVVQGPANPDQPAMAVAQPGNPLKIQGPEAGQVVAPPTRDVTPNYQLSPLHQIKPLTREEGLPLPPKPKREPLPEIFRRVVVKSPTELILRVDKTRKVNVTLAHVEALTKDRQCWLDGRAAPCLALGKTALRRYLRQRAVMCDWLTKPVGEADDEADTSRDALCYLGINRANGTGGKDKRSTDLAAWLVRYGWVIPEAGHYEQENRMARDNALGVYATESSAGSATVQARQQEWQELSDTLDAVGSEVSIPETSLDLDDELPEVTDLPLIGEAPDALLAEPNGNPRTLTPAQ
ncbi:hypothetical protein [uncultured Cohaesibacter sp.]|uniref:hypothetical protein n=1 Tax=uncultured Cohaesibacter sp. TaxID=1002546 RepID=UPI0029C74893|nr:hypothetical protein [uncultured Cohaesibacter sp.]